MEDENKYLALTPNQDAMEIVKKCFKEEKNGDLEARRKAALDLKKVLIKTDDGSYTLNSNTCNEKQETMHTYHGAIKESLEKYVKPARLEGKKEVQILDICSGLGYNAASIIEFVDDDVQIEIDMVEISKETVAAALLMENPLKSYQIIKGAVEQKLLEDGYLQFRLHQGKIPQRIDINIHIEDAREVIKGLKGKNYDAIFLDPFSPLKSPELYTLHFFHELKYLLKDNGVILTYTSAAPVRSAMVHAGLYVGEGPKFGRKKGGTIASNNPLIIEKSLSMMDERMIALSDVGIPFRDPDLNETSLKIIDRRDMERRSVRGSKKFASTVKTPLYLYEDMEDSRLKRRVLKTLNMLGIDDLKSKKAAFIICPQFDRCLCSCGIGKMDNSKDRIYEMEKRLEIISKNPKI
ncbi:MAG: MnmC family methyltransferase [Methanobacterium sp.]